MSKQKLYHQQQLQKCRQNCDVPEEYDALVAGVTAQQPQDPTQVPFTGGGGHFAVL